MRLYRYNLQTKRVAGTDWVIGETPKNRSESTAPYRCFAIMAKDMRRMEAEEGDRIDIFAASGRIIIGWGYRMDVDAGHCRWFREV